MSEESIEVGLAKEVYVLRKYLVEEYESKGDDDAVPFEEHVLTYIDGELASHTVDGEEVNDAIS